MARPLPFQSAFNPFGMVGHGDGQPTGHPNGDIRYETIEDGSIRLQSKCNLLAGTGHDLCTVADILAYTGISARPILPDHGEGPTDQAGIRRGD